MKSQFVSIDFRNKNCHIINYLLTSTVQSYGKISNLGLAVFTSLSFGQYKKASVSYFPVKTSLSVNKQLIPGWFGKMQVLNFGCLLYCIRTVEYLFRKIKYVILHIFFFSCRKTGVVINISSIIACMPCPFGSVYCASKVIAQIMVKCPTTTLSHMIDICNLK